MKKILVILGIIVWVEVILVGVNDFLTTHDYKSLVVIALVVIIPLLIIFKKRFKKNNNVSDFEEHILSEKENKNLGFSNKERKRNLKQLKENGLILNGCFNHINGLNLFENTMCEVFLYSDRFEFKSGSIQFKLAKSKIVDISITTDTDIQKQYVSSIGGAVGGAVLFGPLGAMIGGRAKQKKTINVSYYMIITYKNENDELKYIGFDVTYALPKAKKFESEFKKTNNTITRVDL